LSSKSSSSSKDGETDNNSSSGETYTSENNYELESTLDSSSGTGNSINDKNYPKEYNSDSDDQPFPMKEDKSSYTTEELDKMR
jgi:hypothetical protein